MRKIDCITYDNGEEEVTLDVFYDVELDDVRVAEKNPGKLREPTEEELEYLKTAKRERI
ncbi:MAG: hypothetical protein ABEK36_04560 [Candidatus Aenigmatarchaeota archaeon]